MQGRPDLARPQETAVRTGVGESPCFDAVVDALPELREDLAAGVVLAWAGGWRASEELDVPQGEIPVASARGRTGQGPRGE